MDQRYSKYVLVIIMITNKLELELVKLQERNYDLKHTIFNAIELLKKGNSEKAIKILKKVLYE